MGVKTLFAASTQKPQSQYSIGSNIGYEKTGNKTGFGFLKGSDIALLRDNFSVSTWLLIGGAIQVLLSFIFPRSYLAFPVVFILGWRIVDAFLIHFGLKKNIWAEGVIDGKWSVGYPSDGEMEVVHGKPGENGPGAVMILGARSNSPLGLFGDGYKGVAEINYHPTGLGMTTRAVESSEKGGQKMWINPIVDASRGAYRSSHGRMDREILRARATTTWLNILTLQRSC